MLVSSSTRQPITNTFSSHRWDFTSIKAPIASILETDSLSSILHHPTPNMLFLSNTLTISNSLHSFTLRFNCADALMYLNPAHIDMRVHNESMDVWTNAKYAVHKPYDWTFSTLYQGQMEGSLQEQLGNEIDYERLKNNRHVDFYDDVILYEDELADNGISIYSVKIRVMNFGWFVLARHFLRVDKVCVKARETRFYHEFGQMSVTKELKLREAQNLVINKKTIDEIVTELPITACQTFRIDLLM